MSASVTKVWSLRSWPAEVRQKIAKCAANPGLSGNSCVRVQR